MNDIQQTNGMTFGQMPGGSGGMPDLGPSSPFPGNMQRYTGPDFGSTPVGGVGFGQMPTNPGAPSTPGGGGTLAQSLAYAQQRAAQGMYTPTNGPQGQPSQGWDGWAGYNPTQPSQSGGPNPQVSSSYSPGSYHGPAPGDGGMGIPPSPMTQVPTGVQTSNFPTPTRPLGTRQWGDMGSLADLTGYKNNPMSAQGTPYGRFMTGGGGNGPVGFNRAAAAGYMRSGGLTGMGSHRAAMENRRAFNPRPVSTPHDGNDPGLEQVLRHQNAGNGQMTAAMTQARNGQAPGVLNQDQLAQRMHRFGY